MPAQILAGGQGGGLDVGVTAGSLTALHGDAIALGRHRADAAHAHVGDRVQIMLGDGTRTRATSSRPTAATWPSATPCSPPSSPPATRPPRCWGRIFVQADHPAAVARRLEALAARYPGLRVSDRASLATATDADREMNRWFGPQFVAEIFAFTSIAVVNTLIMIALAARTRARRSCDSSARPAARSVRWRAGKPR